MWHEWSYNKKNKEKEKIYHLLCTGVFWDEEIKKKKNLLGLEE